MPAENLEEQGLEKNPDLNLAQLKFSLTLSDFKNDSKMKEELMQAIQKDSKCYEYFCIFFCLCDGKYNLSFEVILILSLNIAIGV